MARVFRDPSLHSPKSIIHTNEQTKRIISGAQLGFHDALDELEIEIVSLNCFTSFAYYQELGTRHRPSLINLAKHDNPSQQRFDSG